MKRVVKLPEIRRRELIDRAQQLFFEKGYERTSVEDIIGAEGVSKGAFYHHFASKEGLLEALAERIADENLAQTASSRGPSAGDALGQLNDFLAASRRMDVAAAPLVRRALRDVFRPENLSLRHRISAATIAKVAPVLAEILENGVREGKFDTPDALGTAEMLLQIGSAVHDTIARAIEATEEGRADVGAEMLDRRLQLFEVAFNRVLGLEDHAVRLVEPGFAAAVLSGDVVERPST